MGGKLGFPIATTAAQQCDPRKQQQLLGGGVPRPQPTSANPKQAAVWWAQPGAGFIWGCSQGGEELSGVGLAGRGAAGGAIGGQRAARQLIGGVVLWGCCSQHGTKG